MAGYADLDAVKAQLQLTDDASEDEATIARITQLNDSLSQVFDQKVGMTWTSGVVATARTVDLWCPVSGLVLPAPVRSVTAVEVDGTWDGVVWADGEALLTNAWRLGYADPFGNVWILYRLGGRCWSGPVRVTAIWGDRVNDPVPIEVTDALTWLVVHHYREETSSPAGQIGPEGLIIPTRNPWAFQRVSVVIDKYRLMPPLAV